MSKIIKSVLSLVLAFSLLFCLSIVSSAQNDNYFNARFENDEQDIEIKCEKYTLTDDEKRQCADEFLQILKDTNTNYEWDGDRTFSKNVTVEDLMQNPDWIDVGLLTFDKSFEGNKNILIEYDSVKDGYFYITLLHIMSDNKLMDDIEEPKILPDGVTYSISLPYDTSYKVIFTYYYLSSEEDSEEDSEKNYVSDTDYRNDNVIFINNSDVNEFNPTTGAPIIKKY